MVESRSQANQPSGSGGLAQGAFVGRQREMAFLQQRVDSARQGQGSLVFLTGEGGIGKTRLAREVRPYAQEGGFLWLEGRYLRDENIPLQPWVEAIRSFLRAAPADMLVKVLTPYGASLAKLAPEVVDRLGSVPPLPAISPEEERRRLFESLAGFFTGIAREQPLVLFLDDLQWAPSIDSLHHLARSMAAERLLILGTYRDTELKEKPTLAKTVLAMNRERLFYPLPLKRLAEDEVVQMVAQALGVTASPELSAMVYQKTEGNPFFVEEMVRYLTESAAVTLGEKGWEVEELALVQLPDSVKAVVGERLERLGEEARGVLTWASVAGQEFSLSLLKEVTGLEEEQLSEVIDRAAAARVLTPHPYLGQEAYAFADEVVRDVLYEGIGPARRRRYHLKVGQTVEKVHVRHLEAHYDALARHFLEGNYLEKAEEYAVKAGDRASSIYSWERAIADYQTALELLEELEADPRQQAEVLEKLSLVTGLGRGRGALGYLERALSIYENLGDGKRAGEVHLRLGRALGGVLDRGQRHSHNVKAVALLEPEGESPELARVYAQLGYEAAHGFGERSSGIPLMEKGLTLAEGLDDGAGVIEAAGSLGHVLVYHTGQIRRGLEVYQRGCAEARRGGNLIAISEATSQLCREYSFLRDGGEALRWAQEAAEAAKQSGAFGPQITSALHLAWAAILRGDAAGALSSLETAQQMLKRGGVEVTEVATPGLANVVSGSIPIFLGDWDQAETELLKVLEFAERTHSPPLKQFWANPALGWLYLEKGDLAGAKAYLEEAAAFCQAGGDNPPELAFRALLVQVACKRRELDEARTHLRRAREIFSLSPDWYGLAAEVHLAEGVLAAAQEHWPVAEAAFQKAVEINRQHHLPYYEARSLLEWGEMYLKRNSPGDPSTGSGRDREKGMQLLDEALAIFQRVQAKKMVEKVLFLQEQAASQPAKAPAYPDGLTGREVEVLRLIALGKSNRQIAEELFISLNTVGHHVSNILSKTGMTNRAGVATYAARHGLVPS